MRLTSFDISTVYQFFTSYSSFLSSNNLMRFIASCGVTRAITMEDVAAEQKQQRTPQTISEGFPNFRTGMNSYPATLGFMAPVNNVNALVTSAQLKLADTAVNSSTRNSIGLTGMYNGNARLHFSLDGTIADMQSLINIAKSNNFLTGVIGDTIPRPWLTFQLMGIAMFTSLIYKILEIGDSALAKMSNLQALSTDFEICLPPPFSLPHLNISLL